MKVFLFPMSRLLMWFISVVFIATVFSCSSDAGSSDAGILPAASSYPTNSIAAEHFSPEVMQALSTIKERFEEGLRIGLEKRSVGYAYTQHAIRLRIDYFDKTPITTVYPFNGAFSLSEVADAVDQLPFVTPKCGFVVEESDVVVNYYCLALDDDYFSYLEKLPDSGGVIKNFVTAYREAKSLTPDMRQNMLLENQESLDFDNWDHQLFYLLFQCWTNEELRAYVKVNAIKATSTQ